MESKPPQDLRLLELPELVLYEIVKYLTGEALKHIRLVCRTLNLYATPRLFESIVLTPHEPHFDWLFDTFCAYNNGSLASHVRTLRFDCRYPGDPSKPCFWHRSHMHRFHYDNHVLRRNVGISRVYLVYLLSEFGKILDGTRLPRLRNIHICGDGLDSPDFNINGPNSAIPSFYLHRFQQLTGRVIDPGSQRSFDSTLERSKFYIMCLLLAVWASPHRTSRIAFENARLHKELKFAAANQEDKTSKAKMESIDMSIAGDFLSTLRSMGYSVDAGDVDDNDCCRDQSVQARRVETMLAEVLAR